ncbi:MAG: aminotransferase class V-fold PLP-dependent enzyme [Chloroflexi bacterium]|nr:aminotransferase class V-fold PLP-dependent enzyme [Chloroflexota bacterium]
MDANDITRARQAIPILDKTLYLNTGTSGLPAQPVIEKLIELTRYCELGGLPAYYELCEQITQARNRVAAFIGANEDELAFTYNASHSLNAAMWLRWEAMRPAPGVPVDVLISDHEYPTTNMTFQYLEQIGKARLIRFKLSPCPEEMLESLNANVTAATRVVVASHVDCNTGMRANVKAVSAWCRSRGIISYIDGAQAVGQFKVDMHDIGCDLYISNGHKWLYGPNGVGLLYVRKAFLDQMDPPMVGAGTIVWETPIKFVDAATRFELAATRPVQVFATMNAVLDWYESFGMATIEARMRELSDYFKRRVLEQPDKYTLICPLPWEQSSAMASIQFRGKTIQDIGEFCGRMFKEGKAILRPVGEGFDALRMSMAYYNVEDEYERMFKLFETELF